MVPGVFLIHSRKFRVGQKITLLGLVEQLVGGTEKGPGYLTGRLYSPPVIS